MFRAGTCSPCFGSCISFLESEIRRKIHCRFLRRTAGADTGLAARASSGGVVLTIFIGDRDKTALFPLCVYLFAVLCRNDLAKSGSGGASGKRYPVRCGDLETSGTVSEGTTGDLFSASDEEAIADQESRYIFHFRVDNSEKEWYVLDTLYD